MSKDNETPETGTTETPVPESEWDIFELEGYGANVSKEVGKTTRVVWAKLKNREGGVIKLARPKFPGAGPQPEGTITYTDLHDLVLEVLGTLEWALEDAAKPALKLDDVKEQGW